MASTAGVAATGPLISRNATKVCFNGLCGRCRCDWVQISPILQFPKVSMASAAGVAATTCSKFPSTAIRASQWPLRPVSLRRQIRAADLEVLRSQWPLRPISLPTHRLRRRPRGCCVLMAPAAQILRQERQFQQQQPEVSMISAAQQLRHVIIGATLFCAQSQWPLRPVSLRRHRRRERGAAQVSMASAADVAATGKECRAIKAS